MREILFRGKRKDNGEWVEGCLHFQWGETTNDGRATKDAYILGMRGEVAEVDPETVGQYTGLTDKNGKWIFEGDILVIRNCREHPVLVKFIEFSWQCVIPNVNAYIHYRHRLENNYTKYEVIGNIHDNPELLEDPNV